MKRIIFSVCFFMPLFCFSQQPKINQYQDKFYKDLLQKYQTPTPPGEFTDNLQSLLSKQAQLSHMLPNGDKVYRLPIDNMPCIVPGKNNYNYNMPVEKGKFDGSIPNAWPRQQLIPNDLPENKKPLN